MDVSGQLHTPAALFQEKSRRYSLDTWLGGPQNRYGWMDGWMDFMIIIILILRI
jgi:hypothetical protein